VVISFVCWNFARRIQTVPESLHAGADVALLQEVGPDILEKLASTGGNGEFSAQDSWEPWPREHYGF
jgi:hypothetical protein